MISCNLKCNIIDFTQKKQYNRLKYYKEKRMYIGIIGDIIDSRKIKDRAEVQKKLRHILGIINNRYEHDITSNFTITVGDEFQGLMHESSNLISVIDYIKMEMHPVKIRFGTGFGEIATEIIKEYAIGADGPAYHLARQAIMNIKKNSKQYEKPYQDVLLSIDSKKYTSLCNLINASLSTCGFLENSWTDKQREAIRLLNNSDDNLTQMQISDTLEIEKSSVHRRLSHAGYFTYKYTKDIINENIQVMWEGLNAD
jgi:hypothetical protein